MPRVLIVTAVEAERAAVARALPEEPSSNPSSGSPSRTSPLPSAGPSPDGVDVVVAGVGPAAAAARTATALATAAAAGAPYALAVSAGIGGGFGQPLGGVVVATSIVAADLGAEVPAEDPAGPPAFTPVSALGFGTSEHRPPPALVRAVAEAAGAVAGPVLTVSTTTGTARRARELASRHPGAAAEAMEGFGVAEAASAHGLPVLELRTVSNEVGPRDRAAWRIPEALAALGTACAAAVPVLRAWTP